VIAETLIRTPLFIDGRERRAEQTTPIVDPASPSRIVGEAAAASADDVSDAVAAARRAFPAWANLSIPERAEMITRAAARSDADWQEDARTLCRENGKVLRECLRDTSMLERRSHLVAGLADELRQERTYPATTDHPTSTLVTHQPLGVVTIIVPFNWPVGILSSALPYALLAGNTVVVKPPRTAPLATVRIAARMASKLPPGVLNVVTGEDEVMSGLIASEDIAKVCFTGSVGGGKRIMAMAASTLTRVTLELGGNDAALVLEDAVLDDENLDRLFVASFSTAGQVCMNVKRIYAHRSRLDEIVAGFATRLERTVLGHGLDEGTTIGPLHSPAQASFVEELIADAVAAGADVRRFGSVPEDESLRQGNFVRPALVVDADPQLRVVDEEQFGPVIPIIAVDSDEDGLRLANDSWAGLGGSVWSADEERARALATRLECGYAWINDHGAPRLDLRAPFGGVKQSGMGREQGIEGIRAFQDTRAVATLAMPTGA
jgi:acyl-CoA reductase-like NAD-dependent aldehyde dehydrogenase